MNNKKSSVNNNIGDYMVNNYEIKKVNNEEILYLYLDFNYEFSKINFKEKQDKFEKIIKDFIKENKIVFKGTTVALIVGGTIIGNIVLNNDSKNSLEHKSEVIYGEVLDTTTITNEKADKNDEEIYTLEEKKDEIISTVDIKKKKMRLSLMQKKRSLLNIQLKKKTIKLILL